jgi:hypothetical protein
MQPDRNLNNTTFLHIIVVGAVDLKWGRVICTNLTSGHQLFFEKNFVNEICSWDIYLNIKAKI